MQCREFSEISESYLSDELLVETNIQVFRHLENCPKCRQEFGAKRGLRQKAKHAVRNADEFQINPIFANRLRANLKETALKQNSWNKSWFAPKFLIPVMATLLIAFTLGFIFLNSTNKNGNIVYLPESITKGLTQLSLIAAGNHKDCALEKLQQWEAMSKLDYQEKAHFSEKVEKPLRAKFSGNIEMLHAHDCIYEGKEFTHVILRKDGHIMSVFVDKSDSMPASDSTTAQIMSEKENGLQVASFLKNNRAIFVISDLSEAENLSAARTLSDSFTGRNSI